MTQGADHEALELSLEDPAATRALGRALAGCLLPGCVVGLVGDLGAGKTALTKAAVAALGSVDEDDVVSPTYVIAVEYPGRLEVVHVDAYRLGSARGLEDLDLPLGTGQQVAFVEWADRVVDALPADRLWVELEHVPGGRAARLTAGGELSRRVLDALHQALGQ